MTSNEETAFWSSTHPSVLLFLGDMSRLAKISRETKSLSQSSGTFVNILLFSVSTATLEFGAKGLSIDETISRDDSNRLPVSEDVQKCGFTSPWSRESRNEKESEDEAKARESDDALDSPEDPWSRERSQNGERVRRWSQRNKGRRGVDASYPPSKQSKYLVYNNRKCHEEAASLRPWLERCSWASPR